MMDRYTKDVPKIDCLHSCIVEDIHVVVVGTLSLCVGIVKRRRHRRSCTLDMRRESLADTFTFVRGRKVLYILANAEKYD